jgi:hypothetical protein
MMPDNRLPVEVWIVLTDSGEYVVATDEDHASELADADFSDDEPRRYVRLSLELKPPNDDMVASVSLRYVEP